MSKMSFNGKDLGVEEEKVEVEVQDTNPNTNEELCQEELDIKGLFDCMMEDFMKDFTQQIGKALIDAKGRLEKIIPKLKKVADKNKKKCTIKLTKEELDDCITALNYSMICINEDIDRCRIK